MKRFVFWTCVVGALLAVWYLSTPTSASYPDLKQAVLDGQASTVTMTDTYFRVTDAEGVTRQARLPKNDASLIPLLENAGITYDVTNDSWTTSLISSIPTILMIGIVFFIAFGKTSSVTDAMKAATAAKPQKVTFADVAGYPEVKAELEDVLAYLRDPKAYGRLGALPPKGILLEGPPGTGKTFLARAVAGEANVEFVATTGSAFGSMFVSVSSSEVRKIFSRARARTPCIIFIDEIDALARKRRGSSGASGVEQEFDNTLNTLLTEMDGFKASDGVVVIAATNRADVLDPAVLRPGRFDRHVQVSLPDQTDRREILARYIAKVTTGSGLDLDHLAVLTVGLAGAHLANLVNEAAVVATRRNAEAVETRDFLQALERAHAGIETVRRLNDDDRRRVAVHEAGHAIAAAAAGVGRKVRKVTILGRGRALGYNLVIPEEGDDLIQTRTELIQEIWCLLGGTIAEEVVFRERSSGAASDLEQVERIVTMLVTRLGLGTSLSFRSLDPHGTYPASLIAKIDAEKDTILAECYDKVTAAIMESRSALNDMTETLLRQDTLNGTELQAILARVPVAVHPPRPS